MTIMAASIPILRALVIEVKNSTGRSKSDCLYYAGQFDYVSQSSQNRIFTTAQQNSCWGLSSQARRVDDVNKTTFFSSSAGLVKTGEVVVHCKQASRGSIDDIGDIEMQPRSMI